MKLVEIFTKFHALPCLDYSESGCAKKFDMSKCPKYCGNYNPDKREEVVSRVATVFILMSKGLSQDEAINIGMLKEE